ncbi:hypothetical protein A5784_16000 [Mycobacterium sp. 852013-50091_SCH5140682]|uniref:DUF3060 domain-containing protein n=1 Tax=Mycobacterium sp. 852013-50091_SCH5140682 TaxID=1834109 RepID=UPI0007EAECFA|nr:DUF3060 domain-containing protein [Mycobacterium sp. 852013-50091_SCH5140682]OBC02411.1 hypothetical protein A5784_16000 [Mycobacterium sp. 852013-50091_SCH5140682]
MDPQDDPEARIRDLERPLADAAYASELGSGSGTPPPTQPWTADQQYPPPTYSGQPPGQFPPTYGSGYPGQYPGYPPPPQRGSGSAVRVLVIVAAIGSFLVAGGVAAYLMFGTSQNTGSSSTTTSRATKTTVRTTQTAIAPAPLPPTGSTSPGTPGEPVTVTGINENRTIACTDNAVIVQGIQNTVTITGHCTSITVSGIQNTITVDAVDTIGVSGMENRLTFHSGEPQISNSGSDNTVEQG